MNNTKYFQADWGQYSCIANNTEGTTMATVDIRASSPIDKEKIHNNHGISNEPFNEVSDNEKHDVMMRHLMHNLNSLEKVTKQMVKAMKESNRYLHNILRNLKKIL